MCTPYWYSRNRSPGSYYSDDDDYDDDYDNYNTTTSGRRLSSRKRPPSHFQRPVSAPNQAYIITPFVYNQPSAYPVHVHQPIYPQAHPKRLSLPARSHSGSSSDSPSSPETYTLHFGPSYMRPQDAVYGPGMKLHDYPGREHDAAHVQTVDGHEAYNQERRRHHGDQWKIHRPSQSDPDLSQLHEHTLRPQQQEQPAYAQEPSSSFKPLVDPDRDPLSSRPYSRPQSHHWHSFPTPTEDPQPSTSHGQSRKLQKRYSSVPKPMTFIPPPHEPSPYVDNADRYSRSQMRQSYAAQEIPSQPAPTIMATNPVPTIMEPTNPVPIPVPPPRPWRRREHRKSFSEPKPEKVADPSPNTAVDPVQENDPFDLRWPWLSSGPYEAIGRVMTGNSDVDEKKDHPKKRGNIPLGLQPGQVLRPGFHPGQVPRQAQVAPSAPAPPGPLIYQHQQSEVGSVPTDSPGASEASAEKQALSEQPQPPSYLQDQRLGGGKSEAVAYVSVLPSKSASSARGPDAGDYEADKERKAPSGSHPTDGAHQPRREPAQPSTLVMPALLHTQSQPPPQQRTELYSQPYLPTQSSSIPSSRSLPYLNSQSPRYSQGSALAPTWTGYEQQYTKMPAHPHPNLRLQPLMHSHTSEIANANVNPEQSGETSFVEPTVVWSQNTGGKQRNVLRKKRKEVVSGLGKEKKVEVEAGEGKNWGGDKVALEQQLEREPERQGGRSPEVRRKLSRKKHGEA